MKKKGVALLIIAVLAFSALTIGIGLWTSRKIEADFYEEKLNLSSRVRVCQISDLHYPYNGVELEKLSEEIKSLSPDLIFLTGDIFDGKARKEDMSELYFFLSALTSESTVYAVIGNHEIGSPLLDEYLGFCKNNGINLLLDETTLFRKGTVTVKITGLKDGKLLNETNVPDYFTENNASLNFVLAHRPELFDSYVSAKAGFVFAGHAHGGQVRFFGKGLYAPDQGLFPAYTSGRYSSATSVMFVSRGLGDGYSSFRCFNPYHLIVVDFV